MRYSTKSDTFSWASLTVYKQQVEVFFTPQFFIYEDITHGASSEDFGNTIVNSEGRLIHFFHPGDYLDEETYAYEFPSDYPPVLEVEIPNRFYNLPLLETTWNYFLYQLVMLARLTLPTQIDNGFHFFFG